MFRTFIASLEEDEIENLARVLRSPWHIISSAIILMYLFLGASLDGRHQRLRKPHRPNRAVQWITKLSELLAGCYGSSITLVGLEVDVDGGSGGGI